MADRAQVAVDTVYAKVGRKPQLLIAVHDMALAEGPSPLPAEERDYVRAVRAAPTAAAMLRTYADAMGRLLPTTVPLLNGVARGRCDRSGLRRSVRAAVATVGLPTCACSRPTSAARGRFART